MRMHAAAVAAAGLLMLGAAGCASTTQAGSGGTAAGSSAAGGGSAPSGTTTGPGMGGPASSPAPTGTVIPTGSAQAKAAAAACPTDPVTPLNNPKAKPVPADVKVAWVLRCRVVSSSGHSTLVVEKSTSDTSALVRALRQPSMPRQKVVCPMIAVYIPNFALVEADGQLLVPKIPLNNCGMAQSDVVTSLNQLTFSQLGSRPLK